ncbi:MAG: hypothetical protein ACLT0Y_02385 [Christensenellales bacterium]
MIKYKQEIGSARIPANPGKGAECAASFYAYSKEEHAFKRLQTALDLLPVCRCIADVGCDHGC